LSELRFCRSVFGELHNRDIFEKTLKHEEGEIQAAELIAPLDFLLASMGVSNWTSGLLRRNSIHGRFRIWIK
jgi:hypothetical protein